MTNILDINGAPVEATGTPPDTEAPSEPVVVDLAPPTPEAVADQKKPYKLAYRAGDGERSVYKWIKSYLLPVLPDFALILSDLEARRKKGIRKYGVELRAVNGRDALTDCYQEALDGVMYAVQALMELPVDHAATEMYQKTVVAAMELAAHVSMLLRLRAGTVKLVKKEPESPFAKPEGGVGDGE